MKINQQWFLDFTEQTDTQFTIPRYQRVYSWLTIQCEELWEDVMRVGRDQISHFISTTLYLDAGESAGGVRELDIIDGQQRIASTIILLTALRDYLRETGTVITETALANQPDQEKRPDLDAEAIHQRFLIVQDGATTKTKIRLIGPDGTTLSALVMGTRMPAHASTRVLENYDYFSGRMHEDGFDAQRLWCGLRELLVIASELDGADKAQAIFESLNTKGIPLTPADLMRNYLLVSESHEEQQRLYQEYWQPMEIMFRDDVLSTGSLKLNTGLRMWLTIRCKRMCIADRSRTYHYFKIYMNTDCDDSPEEVLDELRSFCYLWAQNYKCNPGRDHCSRFDWAKKQRGKTLIPSMSRAADVSVMVARQRHHTNPDGELYEVSQKAEVITAESAKRKMSPLYHRGVVSGPVSSEREGDEQLKVSLRGSYGQQKKDYETMTFGQWGGEPISWRILKQEDDALLLITEHVIDCVPYHSYYQGTTWADCDLRVWANTTFIEDAFTEEEASHLIPTLVHTPGDHVWKTTGGADCEDRVFVLSFDEADQYFKDGYDRMATPTDFAYQSGIYVEKDYSLWWLRSPGHGQGFATTVWPVGGIDTAGSGVGRAGVGFRPAIRVKK